MTDLIQVLFSGLAAGTIYGLAGIGIVAIYSVRHIVNLAQGEFVSLGGLTAVAAIGLGLPLWVAILIAVPLVVIVAITMERLAIAPLGQLTTLTSIILTLAISTVLKAVMLLIWGPQGYRLEAWAGSDMIIGGVSIRSQELWIIGIALVLTFVIMLGYERTTFGKALRACAEQPTAARLLGISPRTATAVAFGVAGLVGGVAGVLGAPIYFTQWDAGLGLGLKAFVAATLGGLTSIRVALLGGMFLGMLENVVAFYGDSGYRDASAFFVLLLVLLVAPQGLGSRKTGVRV